MTTRSSTSMIRGCSLSSRFVRLFVYAETHSEGKWNLVDARHNTGSSGGRCLARWRRALRLPRIAVAGRHRFTMAAGEPVGLLL